MRESAEDAEAAALNLLRTCDQNEVLGARPPAPLLPAAAQHPGKVVLQVLGQAQGRNALHAFAKSGWGRFQAASEGKTFRAFGAPNLCPTTVSMSTPRLWTSNRTLPRDWAPSVWTRTPGWRLAAAAISLRGWMDPTSLLLCITVTRHVSPGRIAASTAAGSTRPDESTGTRV